MGTLQENQSLNAEYERNKKEREMKEEIERLNNIIKEVRKYIKRYLRLNLDAFDIRSLLEKELEILDKENK